LDETSMNAPKKTTGRQRGGRHGPSVLVLAAGESTRFLGTKQLVEIGGKTLVEWVIDAVPSADVAETVLVLGHEAQSVERAVGNRKGVRVVVNRDYGEGMGSSIRSGILALAKDSEGAMLLLADQPLVTRPLLRRMLRAFKAGDSEGKIVAATFDGLVTPPVIFSRSYFRELAELKGDQGARSVIERHPGSLHTVRVRSGAVLADIDTRQELEVARHLLEP
jgi:molybdenum cofactor cytidylyltransferase